MQLYRLSALNRSKVLPVPKTCGDRQLPGAVLTAVSLKLFSQLFRGVMIAISLKLYILDSPLPGVVKTSHFVEPFRPPAS